jgi:hypothetical protein
MNFKQIAKALAASENTAAKAGNSGFRNHGYER